MPLPQEQTPFSSRARLKGGSRKGRSGAKCRVSVASDAVTDPGLGHDQVVQGTVTVGVRDLPTHLADIDVDVVVLVAVSLTPYGTKQPRPGDEAPSVSEQDTEDFELARREIHGRRPNGHHVACSVEDEISDPQPALAVARRTRRTPQKRAQARVE